MIKLFVDTNAFFKMGHNFDEKNPVISIMLKNIKDNEFEYHNLSIIDNEIIEDLKERGELAKSRLLKRNSWIEDYVSKTIINDNCFKELNDYLEFKKNSFAVECNVSEIDPEKVFSKYFSFEYPFEKKAKKRKEFPDAFISEYLNSLEIASSDTIYFVTNDNGLKKSLNSYIKIENDLESFLTVINGISSTEYSTVKKFVLENLSKIAIKFYDKLNIDSYGLEYDNIEINKFIIPEVQDIQVIDSDSESYVINIKCSSVILEGEFSCMDYANSYMPNDYETYVIQEFISTDEIIIEDYDFVIQLQKNQAESFDIIISDYYNIAINYNMIVESDNCHRIEPYIDYAEEDSWSQDAGLPHPR